MTPSTAKDSPRSRPTTGVYCLANDTVIEWFEAFIRSYPLQNAGLPLTVIPFNENIPRLKALQKRFRFEMLEETDCRRFDGLAQAVLGTDRLAGAYRKFACFFGPYDEFLFLDSDVVVLTPLQRLFDAYNGADYDLVYFDFDMEMAYTPEFAARMLADHGSQGINTGAFLSRKGVLTEADLWSLAGEAAKVRAGLIAGVLEQSFFNLVFDVQRRRLTGMDKLLPELAPKVWARQPFHYDRQHRIATNPDGKILPFIHWPGCGYPMMVRPEIFLEYRTLGMSGMERTRYLCEFYYRRLRRQWKYRLQKSRWVSGWVARREERLRLRRLQRR